MRAKKNFWGPGKFCRLSWNQGFEYVTGTGSQKKTFGAPESFVGFCGTRGSNMHVTGTGSQKKIFWGQGTPRPEDKALLGNRVPGIPTDTPSVDSVLR